MKEAYVNICGVPTHIITWGKWIEETLDGVDEIVICVTGNPGLPGYYTEFLGNLYKRLNCEIPIWVIGQLGHDDPPATSIRQVPPLMHNEALFDLDGQMKHKLEFIRKFVPQNVKIHLIGHSIGSWMILQLLKEKDVKDKIQKGYLLFPTIERMLESPSGWIFTNILVPVYILFGFLLTWLNYLPDILKILIISFFSWVMSVPKHFLGTTLKYMSPPVLERVVFLAKDEMVKVRSADKDIIRENINLLKFYYGTRDGWVPVKYFKQLCKDIPGLDATLDTRNIAHAFVIRQPTQMAETLSEWISSNSVKFNRPDDGPYE